jgi:hypothetical protein
LLAIVPARLVAVIVTSAGVMCWRLTLGGGFELGIGETVTLEDQWAAVLPELLWPAWAWRSWPPRWATTCGAAIRASYAAAVVDAARRESRPSSR